VPVHANKPYDIKDLIAAVVDDGALLEVQPDYARTSSSASRARRALGGHRRQPARDSAGASTSTPA
jgi:hypothetical protein